MEEYEVDLRDYIRVIWAKKWIILAVFVISVVAAVLFSFRLPEEYETKALIRLNEVPAIEGVQLSNPGILVARGSLQPASVLLKSRDILTKTVEEMELTEDPDFGGSSPQKIISWLEEHLKANHLQNTDLLEVGLRGALSPELLKNILGKHIALFKEKTEEILKRESQIELEKVEDKERVLKAQREELLKQIAEINKAEEQEVILKVTILLDLNSRLQSVNQQLLNLQLARERVQKLFNSWSPLEVISSPFAPEDSVGPNRKMNILIAGVLGLFLGVLLAFFVHYMEGGSKSLQVDKSQVNIKRGGEER